MMSSSPHDSVAKQELLSEDIIAASSNENGYRLELCITADNSILN